MLQQDLDQSGRCAKEWQMECNADKCEVLQFALSNQGRAYRVNARALGSIAEQSELGVQVP